ncbi:membrane protein insertase YidC [Planosporangium thailandense]|uniref:Membrane protein insertase YidC n=1 Tax=Planosporangium thailandense TaxID=765197 RepID=A0ABX0XS85_9ACTN|nr:membrane protein insertase YidC [Planosporangium thailandense]NJC68833.1 membrane protein insertase YidC [Planosporangium thailandense]
MAVIYEIISRILLFWHAAWHKVLGNGSWLGTNWTWVLGIICLVLTVRAILFPVFVKQIKSQRAMQALQPKIKALQEKHKGDRETLQQELMKLYREEKANPLMGCLPMFLQVPVFIGLFHVLRHLKPTMPEHLRTLYGWTAGQFESASHAKLFGAPIAASLRSTPHELALLGANGTTVKIVAAILIAAMMGTTFLTSRQMILKTGWAEDPQQRMVQRLMLYGVPFSLLISGTIFPIGVVIYWVTTNLFSLGQQMWVLRKFPPPNQNGAAAKQGAAKQKAKAPAKGGDKNDADSAKTVDARALAPKVGAKPVNPKKGGAAKR